MTIDAEFLELMPLTVDVEPYTGEDAWGNNTYGPAVQYRCRPENPQRTMDGSVLVGSMLANEPRTVRLIVDYNTAQPITARSRVTMQGEVFTVTTVVTEWDENGPYYQDVTCQSNKEG